MIRIGHSGDWHLTSGDRFGDTLRCLESVVDDWAAQGAQLGAILGDLFGNTVPYYPNPEELNSMVALVERAAESHPVVMCQGNHDPDLVPLIFGELRAKHRVVVFTEPGWVDFPGVRAFCVPYLWTRSILVDFSGSREEQYDAASARATAIVQAWKPLVDEAHAERRPAVLLGHGAIVGALLAGGEVLPAGGEVEFETAALEAVGFDYIGFSHVHQVQQLGPRTWFAGSPSRSNFGEETDEKGHLLIDVAADEPPIVTRRLTPARRFRTLKAKWSAAEGLVWDGPRPEDIANNAEVRVRVEYDEQDSGAVPFEAIQGGIVALGAVDVKLEKKPVPKIRVRCEAILTARSAEEKASAYWDSLNSTGPSPEQRARCLAKIGELQQ